MHFFTSITASYIPRARILAKTLKMHNSNAIFHIVLSDNLPEEINWEAEPFDYIWYPEDFIPVENIKQWIFKHTLVELCTAVKGQAALHILKQTNAEKLVYFDPDIAVFDNLDCLEKMLNKNSFLVIPHNCDRSDDIEKVLYHEMSFLKNGIYNFGFFAVKNDDNGIDILNWWTERLLLACYDDSEQGLFTDQKWGNFIPVIFDKVKIIKEPNYDVATWNLTTRTFSGSIDNGFFVNNMPLKFYHFSGYGSTSYHCSLAHLSQKTRDIFALSDWYGEQLIINGNKKLKDIKYKYARFYNGKKIENIHRLIFRKNPSLMERFADPFDDECYDFLNDEIVALEFENDAKRIAIFAAQRVKNELIYIKYKLLSKFPLNSKKNQHIIMRDNLKRKLRVIRNYIKYPD